MAVIVEWSESNGVGKVNTDGITNVNFGSNDSYNLVHATYPIVAGNNSFSKYLRVKFTGSGWTTISNMKFWKSLGALGVGETIKAVANIAYATPSATDTGDSNCPVLEGSALAVDSYEGAVTIINGATGVSGYTDYIRLQLQTTVSTPSGVVAQKTFKLQYDIV